MDDWTYDFLHALRLKPARQADLAYLSEAHQWQLAQLQVDGLVGLSNGKYWITRKGKQLLAEEREKRDDERSKGKAEADAAKRGNRRIIWERVGIVAGVLAALFAVLAFFFK